MTNDEIRAFEKALRIAIEAGDFAAAEAAIRAALREAPDPVIEEALGRPLDRLRLAGWDGIAADMHNARRNLPEQELAREWEAVLFGLINRHDAQGPTIVVKFTFDAAPRRAADGVATWLPSGHYAAWMAENEGRLWLPQGRAYEAYRSPDERIRIEGLEALRSVHARSWQACTSDAEREAVLTAQSLAPAVVLLRFHQLVGIYVERPVLPRSLAVFAYGQASEWPMETGTTDYGTEATRLVRAKGAAGADAPAGPAAAARIRREREAALIARVRGEIEAYRELDLALSLWPWWRHREERRRFAMLVDTYADPLRIAVDRAARGEGAGLSGERLCVLYAEAQLGRDAARALESSVPPDRGLMHGMGLYVARRFGGSRVEEAFPDIPPPPAWLLARSGYDR